MICPARDMTDQKCSSLTHISLLFTSQLLPWPWPCRCCWGGLCQAFPSPTGPVPADLPSLVPGLAGGSDSQPSSVVAGWMWETDLVLPVYPLYQKHLGSPSCFWGILILCPRGCVRVCGVHKPPPQPLSVNKVVLPNFMHDVAMRLGALSVKCAW